MILHYATLAIKQVNKFRTQFKIKGKTPIKLVALLMLSYCKNTCIKKEEILGLFELQTAKLAHC